MARDIALEHAAGHAADKDIWEAHLAWMISISL